MVDQSEVLGHHVPSELRYAYVRQPQSESIHWCKTTQVKDVEAKLPVSSSKNKCLKAARRTQLLRLFEATVEIPPRQLGHFMYIIGPL